MGLIFLSTCPARGTTSFGEGDALAGDISIHVPREGHDHTEAEWARILGVFLSTCPARGTTIVYDTYLGKWVFLSTCPARGTTNNMI